MTIMHQCAYCRHLQGQRGATIICAAFPQGIPVEIVDNEFDHKQAYPGDHGTRWEQSENSLQRIGPIDLFTASGRPEPALSKAF